jgi:glycosyltransferase involved in cell wall biosynthesis
MELCASNVSVVIMESLAVIDRFNFGSLGGLSGLVTSFATSFFSLVRLIRHWRPDVVHTNTSVILSSGLATVVTRIPHLWHVRESFAEFPLLFAAFQWYMYLCSTKIACVSSAMARQFSPMIEKQHTVTLHNGFPRSEFESINVDARRRFREEFGLEGFTLVGLPGRVRLLRKGQDTFVRAASLLVGEFPNVRFVIIGSPFPGNESHLDQMRHLIADLRLQQFVIYTGEARDIKAALAELDISVLASAIPEPFGGVVVESMALAKPVVGTNIGGTVEQIQDGTTGYLVPANDPQALADAIRTLLLDPDLRRRMGVCGRKRFEEEFEFEPFYRRLIRLYESILKR